VEYGLLVALIAAVFILAVQGLGRTLNTTFTNVNSLIAAGTGRYGKGGSLPVIVTNFRGHAINN
jgi:Flp pilus assembly pilin Flp